MSMPATTKGPRRRKTPTKAKSRAAVAKRARVPSSKVKPITVTLAPDLLRGMEMLRVALKRPVNTMINEAVKGFIQRRTAEVDADLAGLLSQVKAHKRRDPKFDAAFAEWARAEAKFGREDPAEGIVVDTETADAKAGPTQTLVRELLNR
jgi:predicted transcriptional regulator